MCPNPYSLIEYPLSVVAVNLFVDYWNWAEVSQRLDIIDLAVLHPVVDPLWSVPVAYVVAHCAVYGGNFAGASE